MSGAFLALVLVAAACGACAGSFLGVVVQRLPRARSLLAPPSHCDSCGTALAWYDNLPILGWLLLRGRCRYCRFPIPASCLWLELAVAALSAGVVAAVLLLPELRAGWLLVALLGSGHPVLAAWLPLLVAGSVLLLLAWLLVAVVIIDYRHLIIPDELSKGLQALAVPLAMLAGSNLIWAERLDGALAVPWDPVHWLRAADVLRGLQLAPTAAIAPLLLAVALGLAALAASLPLARYVYGHCVQERWDERDHRALVRGAWWFGGCLAAWTLLGCAALLWLPFPPARGLWDAQALFAQALLQAVLGALTGWWLPWLVAVLGSAAFRRNAMGYGDVKLFAALGAFLGPLGTLVAFLAAILVGTLVGIPARLLGAGRELPFGPALAYGTALAIAAGPWLWPWLWARCVAPWVLP
ncbi:MAG: prepilin peptidase [Planctomycetota bacterium]|nr:prepilin peptidase [Planctomycetota bacterium]MDW8373801.1 prepilin peptidase [Planctomycetota bacterium]